MPLPTLSEIVSEEWPGAEVTFNIDSDDDSVSYANMAWFSAGIPKPTLAEMQAKRDSARTKKETRDRQERVLQNLLRADGADNLAKALLILADNLNALHASLRANNTVFSPPGKPSMTGLDALRTRLNQVINSS